ncbi:MAG: hypothetical protein WC455_28550 [Dehalococcoidia bacterium]|jgi:hypothetical protein
MDKPSQISIIISALSSCAIENNTFASDLLKLKDKDYPAFIAELKKMGWLTDEDSEAREDCRS